MPSSYRSGGYSRYPSSGYSAGYSTQEYGPSGLSRRSERPSSSARDRAGARFTESRYADRPTPSRSSTRPSEEARARASQRYADMSFRNEAGYAYQERSRSPFGSQQAEYTSSSSSRRQRYYAQSPAGPVDPFEAQLRGARESQFWERGNDFTDYRSPNPRTAYTYHPDAGRYNTRGGSYTQGGDSRYNADNGRTTGRYGSLGSYNYRQPGGYGGYGRTSGGGDDGMDRLAREAAARRSSRR